MYRKTVSTYGPSNDSFMLEMFACSLFSLCHFALETCERLDDSVPSSHEHC
jgi:hypothetical protein